MKIHRIMSIPYLCDNRRYFTLEYDLEEFREEWKELWTKIANILAVVKEYSIDRNLDPIERIGLVIDFIVWSLRAPVFIDTIEDVMFSPYKYYVFMRLSRYIPQKINIIDLLQICRPLECPQSSLIPECKLATKLFGKCKDFTGLYKDLENFFMDEINIEGSKIRRWIYLLGYPADTRPGYNTTSLVAHSILVSSISWIIAYLYKSEPLKAMLYALAGLLHDIGKPVDPQRHVEETIKLIEETLSDVLKDILGEQYYNELLELVRRHHEDEILRTADHLAAGERNSAFVVEALREDIVELLKIIREKDSTRDSIARRYLEKAIKDPRLLYEYSVEDSRTVWSIWNSLYEIEDGKRIRAICEKYGDKLWKKELEFKPLAEIPKKSNYIRVLSIDIRRIQETIGKARDLRIMAVSSHLIDYWLITHLPIKMSEYFSNKIKMPIPLPNFIILSGGNALILVPNEEGMLNELISNIKNEISSIPELGLNLEVAVATTVYNPYYWVIMSEITKKISVEKLIEFPKERIIHPGIGARCDLCGSSPASYIIDRFGETIKVCGECFIKWNIASKIVYGIHKLQSKIGQYKIKDLLIYPLDEISENDLMKYLIEQLSGLPPKGSLQGRLLNYSVISIDGNLMGYYMTRSNTFTEAIEKSYRIDYALKVALRRFSILLENAINELIRKESGLENERIGMRERARFYLGVLYAGGDDALLIAPTYLALPLAIYFAQAFNRELGCTATLSIGITSAPPKHSVWGLRDTSIGLMENTKEEIGREQALKLLQGNKDMGIASLNLYYTESTSMITSARVLEFYDKIDLIAKKYLKIDSDVQQYDDLYFILNKIFDINWNNIEELITKLLKNSYLSIIKQCSEYSLRDCIKYYMGKDLTEEEIKDMIRKIDEIQDKWKRVRDISKEVMRIVTEYGNGIGIQAAILYIKRQLSRFRGEHEIYSIYRGFEEMLLQALLNKTGAPLMNVYMIVKILGGGAL